MTISMYQASVPVLTRMLNNLAAILDKAAVHAADRKIDPAVLLSSRLYPDMFPLVRQVQIATDNAKGCAARLAGQDPPKFEDNESTIPELLGRIHKTVSFLGTFTPEQIDGSEQRPVVLKFGDQQVNFEGLPYLLNFVMPNFYFHATPAYCILRHCGVEIGKMDFTGRR